MDFSYMLKVFPEISKYVPVTLLMAVAAMVLAILVAAVLSVGQHHKSSRWLVDFYVLIFRGFPTLVIFLSATMVCHSCCTVALWFQPQSLRRSAWH